MKKKFLLGFFAVFVAFSANAQDKAFNFGFKVAPAISWLGIDDRHIENDGSNVKCNWGFFGEWNFAENFSLVSGFNVNFLGGKYKFPYNVTINGVTGEEFTAIGHDKIKLTEFELPVAFQMRTNDINDFKFYAQIGLAGAAILKAKDDDGNKIKDARKVAASYFVAGGAEYAVTGVSLIAQLKYNGGLTTVMSKHNFADTKANFVELGLGVMF